MKFKFNALKLSGFIIIIFILQLLIKDLTSWFVLDQTAYTQFWRFLTSIFLHGGLAHLISNLFALALFGSILESLIGGKKFALIFFTTGIIANMISVNFYSSSLGASGAIFGIIGALVIIRPTLSVWAFGMPMPMFIAGILWFVLDIIGIFVPSDVGNITHISGLFTGIIFGLFYRDWSKKEKKQTIKIPENYLRDWEDVYMK
jgi:hypothetical protein